MVSFLSVSLSFSFCFFVLSDSVLLSLPLLVRVLPVNQTNALGSLSTTVYNIPRGLPSSSLDAAMCVCLRPLPLSSNASYVCAAALSLMPAVVRHHRCSLPSPTVWPLHTHMRRTIFCLFVQYTRVHSPHHIHYNSHVRKSSFVPPNTRTHERTNWKKKQIKLCTATQQIPKPANAEHQKHQFNTDCRMIQQQQQRLSQTTNIIIDQLILNQTVTQWATNCAKIFVTVWVCGAPRPIRRWPAMWAAWSACKADVLTRYVTETIVISSLYLLCMFAIDTFVIYIYKFWSGKLRCTRRGILFEGTIAYIFNLIIMRELAERSNEMNSWFEVSWKLAKTNHKTLQFMALGGFSHPVNWTEISNMRNLLGWRVDMDESGALVNKSIVKEFVFQYCRRLLESFHVLSRIPPRAVISIRVMYFVWMGIQLFTAVHSLWGKKIAHTIDA